MSIFKKELPIYSNLPSGGALTTNISTSSYLAKYFKTIDLKEPTYKITNIFSYLFFSFLISPMIQKNLMRGKEFDVLVVYQSWLVRSPYLLRFSNSKKIYICHEPPREFYDKKYIRLMSHREKFVNFIRLPIKWVDYYNATAKNVTFVVNSKYSKKIIDKIYKTKSIVIYPGINVIKYQNEVYKGDKNYIVTIGAINKLKNQLFYIQILSKISRKYRPTLLLIANGYDRDYLNLINFFSKKLEVEVNIKLNVSEKEKISLLKHAKLFIYSPVGEPFGIAIVEAISSGVPIAAYNRGGGYSEIINQKNGLIFSNLKTNEWSNQITKYLKNDKAKHEYSNNNLQYSRENFGEKSMNEKILRLININL